MPTLDELVTPKTEAQLTNELLSHLAAEGLPVTDWHSGGVARTLIETDAWALADLAQTVAAVARGGLLDTANGAWLSLLAAQVYGVERHLSGFATHRVRLSAVPAAGPHSITPGQLWLSTTSGKRFRNVTGGTLEQGGTLELDVRAEQPGAAYNVGVGQISLMIVSLPGVSCTNPDLGAGSSLLDAGTDEESDDSLRARCRDVVPTLGPGATAAAYRAWAHEASEDVTRVVAHASDALGVTLYLAGPAGAVTEEVVASVQAYVDERRPLSVDVVAQSVVNVPVHVTATLRVRASYRAAAEAALSELLSAFLLGRDPGATVYRSALVEVLMAPDGMEDAELAAPADAIPLAAHEVAVLGSLSLTWIEV